jgi:hypothetical protein
MVLPVKGRGYVISPAEDRTTQKGGLYKSLIVNCGDSIKPDHWYLSSFHPEIGFGELAVGDLIDFSGNITKWAAKDAKGQLLKNAYQLAVNISDVILVQPVDAEY